MAAGGVTVAGRKASGGRRCACPPYALAAALLVFTPLAGCSPTDLRWTEEVKLHDGRVIVLQRREELTASGFPVQRRGFNRYHQFCYPPMGITWRSKPDYFPETFDIVDGKAYAKVSIGGDVACMLHGYPKTNALYFRWEGKAWKKIPYEEYPKGLRYNLLGLTYDHDPKRDAKGLVSLAEKRKRDAGMYWDMENRGVMGLNDLLTDQQTCEAVRSVVVTTNDSPEVFLPMSAKDCE